LEQEASVFRF